MSARNVAVIILYRADGRILLQHRTKDAPTFPGFWAFFGGGIEAGESAETAVKRESLEELGYALAAPRLFTAHAFVHQGNEHTMHVFVKEYDGSPLTLGEGQGLGWYSPGETLGLLMNDHDRLVIRSLESILDPDNRDTVSP